MSEEANETPKEPTKPSANARAPRPGFKDHLKPLFLEAYKRTESHQLAAKEIGVDPTTVSRWKRDKKFLKEFTAAHLEAVAKNNDNLKTSNLSLAIHGNPHFLIDRKTGQYVLDAEGKRVVLYREYYPNLSQFFLKNRMPDEFKDKFEHEISGQLIMSLSAEFSAILRKHVPAQFMPAIQKELETLSAKLGASS